ncbi:unnamed protein product [Urochloa humidicola]
MSASRKLFQATARSFASASHRSSPASILAAEGCTAALAAVTNLGRKTLPTAYAYHKSGSHHAASGWGAFAATVPVAIYMLQDQEAHATEMERTFIAIKPDGVRRGLFSMYAAAIGRYTQRSRGQSEGTASWRRRRTCGRVIDESSMEISV